MKIDVGETAGYILKSATMRIQSIFGNDSPRGLAVQLLSEIDRGLKPVYPSTPRHAARLVEGLAAMWDERPDDVTRAVLLAPRDGALDWRELMTPLTGGTPSPD